MNHLHASIDDHAESAHEEIRLQSAIARRQIKRMAEFPARSEGKRNRYKKEVAISENTGL